HSSAVHRVLPSFPTRRSSDLLPSHHPPSPGGKVSAQPNAALSRRHLLQLLGLGAGATSLAACAPSASEETPSAAAEATTDGSPEDRKSTRLNSSHVSIS